MKENFYNFSLSIINRVPHACNRPSFIAIIYSIMHIFLLAFRFPFHKSLHKYGPQLNIFKASWHYTSIVGNCFAIARPFSIALLWC